MSKKKRPGRTVPRRRAFGPSRPMVPGVLYFDGPPEFKRQVLAIYGGEEGILQAMRDACPICAVGGVHDDLG